MTDARWWQRGLKWYGWGATLRKERVCKWPLGLEWWIYVARQPERE